MECVEQPLAHALNSGTAPVFHSDSNTASSKPLHTHSRKQGDARRFNVIQQSTPTTTISNFLLPRIVTTTYCVSSGVTAKHVCNDPDCTVVFIAVDRDQSKERQHSTHPPCERTSQREPLQRANNTDFVRTCCEGHLIHILLRLATKTRLQRASARRHFSHICTRGIYLPLIFNSSPSKRARRGN